MNTPEAAWFLKGQTVEVRSEHEILSALEPDGTLGGLPFMPEMKRYCGRRFRVAGRSERTCVEGCRMRRVKNTVFLENVRCDGSFHDGCERGCLIFWKEAWLRPAEPSVLPEGSADAEGPSPELELPVMKGERFWCQSTELQKASTPLPWWDPRQYLRDLVLKEATFSQLARQLWLLAYNRGRRAIGKTDIRGTNSGLNETADATLHLEPGELVEIRSKAEIEATLDVGGRNRGLEFTPDMVQYCGRRYRVAGRVEKIILECSGRMRHIRDTVILENLVCDGRHARGCPRANYHYWREAWLRRVESRKERTATEIASLESPDRIVPSAVGNKP